MQNKTKMTISKETKYASRPSSIMTEYEKERRKTIEKNITKFEELSLHKLAKDLMDKHKDHSKKKKEKSNSICEEDQEYTPIEDDYDYEECSNEESGDNARLSDAHGTKGSTSSNKSNRKIIIPIGKRKQALCPAMSMDEFIRMQNGEEHESQGHTKSKHLFTTVPHESQRENVGDQTLSVVLPTKDQGDNIPNQCVVASASNKKGRGPTQLFEIHQRALDNRVAIYCNDQGQPIGPETEVGKFSLFLGTIATEHRWAPLTYTSWKKVPNKDKIWEYVNKKYILPPTSEKWVMATINASWRGFKCRIKEQHFKKYENNEERTKHRPKRVPEPDFKILLEYWSNPQVQDTSDKNTENRNLQDNNHIVGPISFARVYHTLSTKEKELPSKRKMFEETRRRKEGREYKQPDDNTRTKLERMKQIEASQSIGDVESNIDAFDEVMNKEHPKRLRLFGKGVCSKGFKGKESGESIVVHSEIVESIKTNMQKELDNHKEAMQMEVQAEKESLAKEREAQAKLSKELQDQVALVTNMKKDLENDKKKAARDMTTMAFEYLCQMAPNTTPEMLAQAIASSIVTIRHKNS